MDVGEQILNLQIGGPLGIPDTLRLQERNKNIIDKPGTESTVRKYRILDETDKTLDLTKWRKQIKAETSCTIAWEYFSTAYNQIIKTLS